MKNTITDDNTMYWKIHTARLLEEVLQNPGTGILTKPLQILGKTLHEVAERASELNDPKLNALMLRLTLYDMADPASKDYDPALIEKLIQEGMSIDENNNTKHGS